MEENIINQELINYADSIDLEELQFKIAKFRNLNKNDISLSDLREQIHTVITFENKSVIQHTFSNCPPGTLLYRVRPLRNSDIPNDEMKFSSDVWNAPEKYVKGLGRLNKKYESLLYVSLNKLTPIKEVGIRKGEPFALIVYKIRNIVKAIKIETNDNFINYPEDARKKLLLVQSFLIEEFSKKESNGEEEVYTVSEIITKDLFDAPGDVQDAWLYPSALNKSFYNMCFRPNIAKDKLSLKGVKIVTDYTSYEDLLFLTIKAVAKPNEKGNMEYFPVGSKEQKRMFPDM